ncbi:tRNA (adenosine(37)-N6)-threonylcarbamoyltransferase complex dimerization subunit type 1 TsaB [Bifidobacterium avesanii]|uniref:tRNA (Adenosine(37)-N6)-threonylcarbamoyltransferase complex dimerization subunit type 1 TsaB n=1 Tax=Bifidobacterium avesanii TaxID=1798157 RepID=A0A7K3TEI5_9BIFI|nr:tRNA (adenosine(37)-N6)-threonylcarbamoyltransferase complex dimerization subunit type 1 TsaB [Bifidobacterium avesanii]KAB8295510.1 tRNA threonylcarbamoyladenosine biosynthesis protein TsaB [Bifidobacterium avesanii]NEG77515.1 tRNA (adenosine(37)-N6)-threonylcarbamoyltransferase complex dimerization subunit type 1 TsaB [Bifidobacterium avesanii]
MAATLVIDTSYGSTVGIVGREPIVETDSRTHVEKLQVNIARAVADAGLAPADLDRIVVGVGPAPFTGLRAGIVAAKALAFATGAKLLGQNVLEPQAELMFGVMTGNGAFDGVDMLTGVPRIVPAGAEIDPASASEVDRHVTLCVNDARRKQLYFTLVHGTAQNPDAAADRWIPMDIDYPQRIVERVLEALAAHGAGERAAGHDVRYVVDVIGHGAAKYAAAWDGLGEAKGAVVDGSLLDCGAAGLAMFAGCALDREARGGKPEPVEPLYLRRPDAEVPNPLKHVLGHGGTHGDGERKDAAR